MEDTGNAGEKEEILFFEDRNPDEENINSLRSGRDKPETQDYVGFVSGTTESPESPDDSERGVSNIACDEIDNHPQKLLEPTENADQSGEEILFVEEDRNPILTGQETCLPKYSINVSVLLH
jgi:hypothetical protein